MLGQIGEDSDGESYMKFLNANAVDTSLVLKSKTHHTGQAFIFQLIDSGDNAIVTVGGANKAYENDFFFPPEW